MNRIRNLLFGLGVFATLGFGVASATAQVGKAEEGPVCPFVRSYEECVDCCGGFGSWSGSVCSCY